MLNMTCLFIVAYSMPLLFNVYDVLPNVIKALLLIKM